MATARKHRARRTSTTSLDDMAMEIADNYINGNITDARKAIEDETPLRAAVLAIAVFDKIRAATVRGIHDANAWRLMLERHA